MSLELRVNGKALALYADTEAQIEHVNNMLQDGLEDDHSLPFDLPAAGNEVALNHAHRLDSTDVELVLENAELWHDGVRLAIGKLEIAGSTVHVMSDGGGEEAYRTTFVSQGLLSRVKGVHMRDLTQGDLVHAADLVAHAIARNDESWPVATHCFPMHLNPGLYGSSNPKWYPDAPDWDNTTAYVVNDLVTYWSSAGGAGYWKRPIRYQCITNNTNRPPATNPSDWRETAYGIVNHWDHATPTFYVNDGVAEWYTMVPFFYLKHYVKETLAHYGLTPRGEWWEDTRYDRRAVYSNQTLDSDTRTSYFRASQINPMVPIGNTVPGDHRLPGEDDSTAPNEDTAGVWEVSTSIWTCPSTGSFRFRCHFKEPVRVYGETIAVRLYNVTTATYVSGQTRLLAYNIPWPTVFNFSLNAGAGEVGQEYILVAYKLGGQSIEVEDAWIDGWKIEDHPYPSNDVLIDPREHAPDMMVDEFLLDLKDSYGLDLRVDMAMGTCWLNYAETELRKAPEEATHRVAGLIEKDHTVRTQGMRFAWDVETGAEVDLTRLVAEEEVDTSADVSVAYSTGLYLVIKNSRMLLLSEYDEDLAAYVWKLAGHLLDEVVVGDALDARTITPQLQPMMMGVVDSNGEEFLVPVIDEMGNSKFYRTGKNAPSLRVVDFHGMVENENAVVYPFASPWGRSPADGSRLQNVDMNWSDDYSAYTLHNEVLANTLVNGESLRGSLHLDHPWLLTRSWARRLHIGNQQMLVLRMPVTYGQQQRLYADGCELLRIKPPTQ